VDRGLVDTTGDGYADTVDAPWVPTYQPSLVTPWPSNKGDDTYSTPYTGGEPARSVCTITTTQVCRKNEDCPAGETCDLNNPDFRVETGNCNYCHDTGTIVAGIPDFIGKTAQDNETNHHDTGIPDLNLPGGGDVCSWCHYMGDPTPMPMSIRTCENCHGIPSVHNIQYSEGGGIINPGAEPPYNGHIGSNTDCNGCHGFATTQSFAPGSGPVIPHVDTLSASSVPAGEATAVTVYGRAFQNYVQGPDGPIVLNSEVDLVASDGTVTTIQPDAINEAELTVTVPATLSAGNYILNVAKYAQFSNAINFAVTPQAVIDSVTCSGGNTTITGSGFGSYLDAANSGTSVTGDVTTTTTNKKGKVITNTTNETATINSWTDTQIAAAFSQCPDSGTVVVNTVFSSGGDTGGGDPPGGGTCSDYTSKEECNADANCNWKKKDGICVAAGDGGSSGGNGGGNDKDKTKK
jgi:hypothetical protein